VTRGRVILVTLSEPYPFGHALGRWYYALLKELRCRRYEVRCLSVTTNRSWADLAREAVEPLGVHLSLHPISLDSTWLGRKWRTLRRPFSYTLSEGLRTDLARDVQSGYDILHLEQLWAGYLAEGRARSLVAVHHLSALDLRGLAFSVRFLFERCLTLRAEVRLLRRLTVIGTLSNRLAGSIRSVNRQARVFVVPYALDPSLYPFMASDRWGEPVIGFLANMKWMPGYLAARRLITAVFPHVKRHVPEAKLLIAGWNARQALSEFVNERDVTIVENVSDPRPYFDRLQVLAYPVPQGSGVKVKVLEAMAWGIPVVTTTDGIEGIEAVDGEQCFIADEDATFAQRVVELLQDAALRRAFRQRARALIEDQHSPVPVVNRLERVYQVL